MLRIDNICLINNLGAKIAACLLCDGGKIVYAGAAEDCPATDAKTQIIDGKGALAVPGFVEVHSHGMMGADFMDGTTEAFRTIARGHLAHGATSVAPTTMSGGIEEMRKVFAAYEAVKADSRPDEAELLGMHLEGPYFSPLQCGAQDPNFVRSPDPAEYMPLLEMGSDIFRWDAAPELAGTKEFAQELLKRGIVAGIAHTDADYKTCMAAHNMGFTHYTHLYSAMQGMRRIDGYRRGGAIEAAYLDDRVSVELIADGHHLPPELIKLAYKNKGADKTVLTTDSMRAAGLGEGEFILGSVEAGQKVIVDGGVAWTADRQAFAGSVATCDRLLRVAVQAGVPLADAIIMLTRTPARLAGVGNRKGDLLPGYDADIVLLDDRLEIQSVLRAAG